VPRCFPLSPVACPFPVQTLQVDGGSEFAAQFEPACQQPDLHRFVLPPCFPQRHGWVETVRPARSIVSHSRASIRLGDRMWVGSTHEYTSLLFCIALL
jgi:hypothetical protein